MIYYLVFKKTYTVYIQSTICLLFYPQKNLKLLKILCITD